MLPWVEGATLSTRVHSSQECDGCQERNRSAQRQGIAQFQAITSYNPSTASKPGSSPKAPASAAINRSRTSDSLICIVSTAKSSPSPWSSRQRPLPPRGRTHLAAQSCAAQRCVLARDLHPDLQARTQSAGSPHVVRNTWCCEPAQRLRTKNLVCPQILLGGTSGQPDLSVENLLSELLVDIATFGALRLSCLPKSRAATNSVPMVRKYPGPTRLNIPSMRGPEEPFATHTF